MERIFDRVASDPREGDVLNFPGGKLSYRVRDKSTGYVIATRENRGEAPDTREIPRVVWIDLVSFACTVEPGP